MASTSNGVLIQENSADFPLCSAPWRYSVAISFHFTHIHSQEKMKSERKIIISSRRAERRTNEWTKTTKTTQQRFLLKWLFAFSTKLLHLCFHFHNTKRFDVIPRSPEQPPRTLDALANANEQERDVENGENAENYKRERERRWNETFHAIKANWWGKCILGKTRKTQQTLEKGKVFFVRKFLVLFVILSRVGVFCVAFRTIFRLWTRPWWCLLFYLAIQKVDRSWPEYNRCRRDFWSFFTLCELALRSLKHIAINTKLIISLNPLISRRDSEQRIQGSALRLTWNFCEYFTSQHKPSTETHFENFSFKILSHMPSLKLRHEHTQRDNLLWLTISSA